MLTPAYLSGIASDVVDTFSTVECDIAESITKRIVRMGRVSATSEWQIEKAKKFAEFRNEVEKTVSRNSGETKRQVYKAIGNAGKKSLAYDDRIYRTVGLKTTSITQSPALQAILLQGTGNTMLLVSNFTKTTANAANIAYQTLLDRAYIQIMSGAFSPNQAIQSAIRELAKKGIEKIAYPSGYADSIESSVRRAVTTGVNQSISKLQLARAKEMDCNLVETSSHAGARPTHAVWQGRVFSLSNPTREYPDFYAETGYGDGDGLCGWNCYHSFYPYYAGLSTQSFSADPAADDGRDNAKEYEEQQKQRYLERQIRNAKKECIVYNTAAENATNSAEAEAFKSDFQRASVRLKDREATLKDFLSSTGRDRDKDREQVGGFGQSVSSKAVWANRKANQE